MASYCGSCFGRAHKRQPVRIWLGASVGNDLNGLTVLQRRTQRYEAAIDLGGYTAIANVGVYCVGKINSR